MANVILCVPEEDWELLNNMLVLDSTSSSTDRDLRQRISAALNRIDFINDHIQRLIDQYPISGYGVGDDIQNLQAVTGIQPQGDDDVEDDGGNTWYRDADEDDAPDLSTYGAWLEDTGEDDSFVGNPAAGIPGTRDKYEIACKQAGVTPDWNSEAR